MHVLSFRPTRPGALAVSATAANPPLHSESKLLGRIELHAPGKAAPVAARTTPIGQRVLGVAYAASAADLTTPGAWSCRLVNGTDANVSFTTVVSERVPQADQQKTATFDVTLLNLILAEAVKTVAPAVHLQSGGDENNPQSYVSWSAQVASLLPAPYKGTSLYPFHLPDEEYSQYGVSVTFHYTIESAPDAPIAVSIGSANGVPTVRGSITLDADSASIVAIDSNVDADKLGIELDIHWPTIGVEVDFNGNLVGVDASLNTTASVAGVTFDVAGTVNGKIDDKIGTMVRQSAPAAVAGALEGFFVNLMRLGPQATIVGYQSDGQTLTVTYTVPAPVRPVAPHPPVVGTVRAI